MKIKAALWLHMNTHCAHTWERACTRTHTYHTNSYTRIFFNPSSLRNKFDAGWSLSSTMWTPAPSLSRYKQQKGWREAGRSLRALGLLFHHWDPVPPSFLCAPLFHFPTLQISLNLPGSGPLCIQPWPQGFWLSLNVRDWSGKAFS